MNDAGESNEVDEGALHGPLGDAVRSICGSPAPAEVRERALETVRGWEQPAAPRPAHRGAARVWFGTAVLAVVTATLLVVAGRLWLSPPRATEQALSANGAAWETGVLNQEASLNADLDLAHTEAAVAETSSALLGIRVDPSGGASRRLDRALAGAELGAVPAPLDGAESLGGFGATASGARPRPGRSGVPVARGLAAGASPAPRLAVAATATVLVSTGGHEPLKLGAQVASLDAAGVLHVWDWSAGDVSRPLDVTCQGAFAVTPDGAAIVTADGRRIDVATGAAEPLDNFAGNVRRVQFSPDAQTLVLQVQQADDTAIIRLLDAKTAELRVEIPRQFVHMFAAAFTADGAELFLMDKDMFIGRWDAWSGESRTRYEPAHTNSIRALAVSGNRSRMASAGPEGEIFLWDVATGKLLHRLVAKQQHGLPSMAYALQFSPDGKRLAGGGPQNLVLWNTESGEVERLFPSSSGGAVHIRYTEDGRFLTTVREAHGQRTEAGQNLLVYPGVHYWDTESGKAVEATPGSG